MLGQAQFGPAPLEQIAAEHALQGFDMVTDCALGQCELFRRLGE